jgi:hypothetical protein
LIQNAKLGKQWKIHKFLEPANKITISFITHNKIPKIFPKPKLTLKPPSPICMETKYKTPNITPNSLPTLKPSNPKPQLFPIPSLNHIHNPIINDLNIILSI